MVNSVQKALGYRDILYNVKQDKFVTYAEGDNYKILNINTGGGGGGEVQVPSGGTDERPGTPSAGDLFWDTDLEILVIWNGTEWVPVGGEDPAAVDSITIKDSATGADVTLSVKDGALIVTDPFKESISNVDLGGTTPDPGHLFKVQLDGSGRYTTGTQASQLNNNGLVTLEYINSPGQFFVVQDIDGGVFGPGDRQGFGLVRETIIDRSDLDGALGFGDGGNVGGWSWGYVWYYTGGYPYLWTTYVDNRQSPGGSGGGASGAMSSQAAQKLWWELGVLTGTSRRLRVGIANGTLTQQDGANYTNRLIMQLYVSEEMLARPEASALPSNVRTNGAGWYVANASSGEYENMGQFPDGKDKGYRFRWSTFGNTTLNQLPYVTGVSDNDQITAASGLSHYVVYNIAAADKTAANSVMASGLIGPNNRLYAENATVDVLQFQQPYEFPNTPSSNVFELKYTYVSAVLASPLFNTYPISTIEEIIDAAQAVAPLENLHYNVCEEVRQAVTAYYLIRDFDFANTALVNTKLFDANQAAVAGQLINTYDAVTNTDPDDGAPEGTGGEILFPAALKNAILEKLALWMATLPDN